MSLERIANTPRKKLTSGGQTVAVRVLETARKLVPDLTLDELTAARLIASEHNRGSAAEQACIVDAEVNRAERKGISLTAHVTGGTGVYGPQGGKRPAATRQNCNFQHLEAARAVLGGGPLRGIAKGATRFFDPGAQDRLHAAFLRGDTPGRVFSCSGRGVLRAWSYDLPKCGRYRCCSDGMPPTDKESGRKTEAWVGPIDGVDPFRLMLMEPHELGALHDARYLAADAILIARSKLPRLMRSPGAHLALLFAAGKFLT